MDGGADAASVSRSVSPQDPEVRDQLHVLQGREMLLSQRLALEREKRMHAERVTETQRQACMELHLLLEKERRLSGRYSKARESKLLRKQKSHALAGTHELQKLCLKVSLCSCIVVTPLARICRTDVDVNDLLNYSFSIH